MKKKTIFWIFVVGGVIGMIVSLGIAQVVHMTAGKETCGMCHTMDPMIQAYNQDIHGGKNPKGLKANCVECHLPHDNVLSYMWGKVTISAHDAWAELTYDKSKIDWYGKRKHAKNFVYDSGCMSCHQELSTKGTQAGKAFLAHRDYFEKRTDKTCVECHENVGHKDLGLYLDANKIGE